MQSVAKWLTIRVTTGGNANNDSDDGALWLACYTQQEIGDAVGVTHQDVSLFLQKMQEARCVGKIAKSAKHDDGFEPEVYSIWNFAKATKPLADERRKESR